MLFIVVMLLFFISRVIVICLIFCSVMLYIMISIHCNMFSNHEKFSFMILNVVREGFFLIV